MPRNLPVMNQRALIRLLERHGWRRKVGGKHAVKMTKPHARPITLPHHKGRDYSAGLTRAILRQARIEPEDWT
jgi:predicted RNA binding protein YcfA (HicA-like mRNA interferase family)